MLARNVRSVLLGAAVAVLLSEFFQYANTVMLPLVATSSNNPLTSVGNQALAPNRDTNDISRGQLNNNHSSPVGSRFLENGPGVGSLVNLYPGQRDLHEGWSQLKPISNEAYAKANREQFSLNDKILTDPPHEPSPVPLPPATFEAIPLPPLPQLTTLTTLPQTLLQTPHESSAKSNLPASYSSATPTPLAVPPQTLLVNPQVIHVDSNDPVLASSTSPDVNMAKSVSVTTIPASKVWLPAAPYTCAQGPVAYYTATPNSQVSVAQLKHRSAPSCRHSLKPHDLVVGVWHCAKCETLIASVEASWAADVTTVYLTSAKGMANAGPQVRALAAQGRVLNTGGNFDDYLSTLGKGLVGLQLMYRQFPTHAWFAIGGDDVFLRPFALTDSLSAFDPDQPWAFSQAAPHARHGFRAFGGAGIVTSRACTRQLADQLGPWASQTNKHGNNNDRLHDVAFVRLLAKQGSDASSKSGGGKPLPPIKLSNLNGLFSQPPGFYLNSALGAKDLGSGGIPLRAGTFHYVRESYMAHLHSIATRICVHCRHIHDPPRSSSGNNGSGGWVAALDAATHLKTLRSGASLLATPSVDSSSSSKRRRNLFGLNRHVKTKKVAAVDRGPSLLAPVDALTAFADLRQKVHASVVVTAASISKREKDEKRPAAERVKEAVASTWGASSKFSIVEPPPPPPPPPPSSVFSRRLSSSIEDAGAGRTTSTNSSDVIRAGISSRRRLSANRQPDAFHYAVQSALTAFQSPRSQFDWFLIISSHVYVVPSNLIALLSAHDPRQPVVLSCPRAWRINDVGKSKKGAASSHQPQLLADPALKCGMLMSRAAAEALVTSASSKKDEGATTADNIDAQPPRRRPALWSPATLVQTLQSVGGLFVADSGFGAVGSGSGDDNHRKRSSASSSSVSGSSRRSVESNFDRQAAAATVGCGPDIIKGQEKRMMYETGTAALKVCHFLLLSARARQLGVGHLSCMKLRTDGRTKAGRARLAEPSLCDL